MTGMMLVACPVAESPSSTLVPRHPPTPRCYPLHPFSINDRLCIFISGSPLLPSSLVPDSLSESAFLEGCIVANVCMIWCACALLLGLLYAYITRLLSRFIRSCICIYLHRNAQKHLYVSVLGFQSIEPFKFLPRIPVVHLFVNSARLLSNAFFLLPFRSSNDIEYSRSLRVDITLRRLFI